MATATGIQETISNKIGENKGLSVVKFETAAVALKFMEAEQNSSKEFDILRTDYLKDTTSLKENASLGEQSPSMLSVEMYTTESDSSDKLLEAKDRWNSISEAKQSTTEPQEHGIDKEKIVLVVTEGEVGVKDENFNNSALQDIASSELTSIEEPMKSETQMPKNVADEAEDAKSNTRTQYSSAIYGFSKQAPECASFKNENVENLDSKNSFELPSNEKNTETDKRSSNEVGRTTDHMKKDNGDVSNEQHTVQLDTFHKEGNGLETESELTDIESLQEAASKVEDEDKLELDVEKSNLEEAESISGNLNLQPEEQNRGTDETTLQDEAAKFRKPDIDGLTAEETEIVTNKLMLLKNEIQVDPHEKVTDLAEMKEDSTTDSPKNTESHDDASAFQISVDGAEVDKGDEETTKQSGEKAMAKENIIRDNLTEDVSSAMLKAENKLLQESEIAIFTSETASEERIHAHSVDKENKSDVISLVQHKEEEDHNEKAQTKINNKKPVATDAALEDEHQVTRNEENTNLHDTMYRESGEEINEPIILTSEARDLDGLLKDNSNIERSHESHYVSHPTEASSSKKEVDAKLEEVMEMRTVDAKVNDFKGILETTKEKHHETSYIDHEDVPHQNKIDQVEVQNGKPTLAVAQTQSEKRLEREGSNELIMQEKLQQFGDFNSNNSVSTNEKARQIETEMPEDESSDKMLDALNSGEASAQENMQGAPASVEEESAKAEENQSTKRDEIEGISVQRSPEYEPIEEEIAKADENGSTTKEETGGMTVERSPHLYPKGKVSEASESREHCKRGLLNEEMDGDTKEKNAESVQHPEENSGNRAGSESFNETAFQLESQEREEVSTASEMTNICNSNEKEQAKIDERVKEGVPQLEPEDHNCGRNDADSIDEDSTIENPNPDNPTEEEDTDRKEVEKRDEIIENVPLTPVSVEETIQNIGKKHEEACRSVPQEQFQDITHTKETTTHSDTPEVIAPGMVDRASIPDLEEQRNIQINEAKKGKIEISEEVYPSEAVVSMYQKNEVSEGKESIIKETQTEAPSEALESILQAKLTEAVRQAEVSQLDMQDKTVNKTKTIGITNNTKKESKLATDKKEERQSEDLPIVMPDGLEADAAYESIEQQKKEEDSDVRKIATAQAEGETGRKSEDNKLENDAAAIVFECHFREHSTKDTMANEDLNEKDLEPVHHSEEVMTPDTHEENNSSNSLEALQDIPAPIEVSTEPVEKNSIEASSPASEEQLQETINTDQNAFSNDPKETIESEMLNNETEAALEAQRNEPIAESGNGKTQRQEEEKWENSVSDLSTSTSAERRLQKEGKKAHPADDEVPMHQISGATESKESMILEEEKPTTLDTSGPTLPSNFTKSEQLAESYGLHRQDTSEGKENQLESMDYKEAESSITESPREEVKDKQPKGETNNQDMELEIDGPFKDILVPIVQEKVAAMTPYNTNAGIETERDIVDKNEATELENRLPEVTAEYQKLEVKDIMDREVSNEVVSLEIKAIETVNEDLKPVDPSKKVDTMDSEDQNIKHNKNGDLHGTLTSVEEAFQEQAEKNKEASSIAEVHVHEVLTADNEAAYETVAETGKGTTEIREEEKNLEQTVDNLSTSNSAYGSIEKEDEEAHPPEVEVLMQQVSRETKIKESLIFHAEKPIAVDIPEEKTKEASGFPKEHVHGAINADTETVAETGKGTTEGVLEEKNLDKTVDNLFNSNSAYIRINKEEEAHPQVKILMNQSSEAAEIKESVILNEEKSSALDIQEVNNEEASGFAEEHIREFVHIDNETIPGTKIGKTEIQEEEESLHKMVDDLFTSNSASESMQKEEEAHLPEAVILMQQTSEAMEIKENVILNEEKVTALDIPEEKNKEASGFAEEHVHGAIKADKDTVAETGNDTTEVKEEKNLDNTVDDLANSNSAYGNIHEEEAHPPEFEIFMHQTSEAVGIKESVILSERQSISMDTPEVKNKEASGFAEEHVQENVCIDNENIPERGGKTEIQKEENLDKTVDDLSTAYKGTQKEEEEAHPSELDLLMHQTSEVTEIIKESITLHEKKVTALDTPEEKKEEAPGFAKEQVHGILHSDKETVSETGNNQTEVGKEEENLDKRVDDWSNSNSVCGSIQDKEEEAHPPEFEVLVHQIVEAREIKESVTLNEKQSTALDILEVKNEEASGFAKEYVHEAVHINNETIPETGTGKTVVQKEEDDLDKTVDELSTSDSEYSSILKEEEEVHPPEVEILMNQTSEETEIKETVILNEEKLTALDILEEKNKEASGFAKERVHGSINADKEVVAEIGNSTTEVREGEESLDKRADDLSPNSAYGSIQKEEEEVHPPEVEVLVYQTTEATEIKENIILNEEKSPVLDAPEPNLPSNFSKGEQLAESHGLDMQDEPEDSENKLEARDNIEEENSHMESSEEEVKGKYPKDPSNNKVMELQIDTPFHCIIEPNTEEVADMTPCNMGVKIETEREIMDKNEAVEPESRTQELIALPQTPEGDDNRVDEVSIEVVSSELKANEEMHKLADPSRRIDTTDSENKKIKGDKTEDLHGIPTLGEELELKKEEPSSLAQEHLRETIHIDNEAIPETGNSKTEIQEEDLDKTASDLSTSTSANGSRQQNEEAQPPEVRVLIQQIGEATGNKETVMLREEKPTALDTLESTLPLNFTNGGHLAESKELDRQDKSEDKENQLESRDNKEVESSCMSLATEEVENKQQKDPPNNKATEHEIDSPLEDITELKPEEMVGARTSCNLLLGIETDKDLVNKNQATQVEYDTQELAAQHQIQEIKDIIDNEVSNDSVSSEMKAIEATCKDLKVVGTSKKIDKVDLEDPQIKDDNIDDCHGTPTVEETVQELEEKNREGSGSAEEHVHEVLHTDSNKLSDAPKEHIDSMALVRPSEPDPGNETMANTKDSKTEISLQNDQLGETLGHLSTSLTSVNENKQRGKEASFVDADDHLFETIEVTKSQENMVLEEEERTHESSESNLSTSSPEYEQIEEIHSLVTRYKSVNIHTAENEISCTDLPVKEVHHTEEPDTDGPSEDIKNQNQEEVGTEKKQAIIEGEMVDQSSKEDTDEGIKPEKLEPDAEEKEYLETDSVKDEVSKGIRAEGEVEINEKQKTTEKRNFEELDSKTIKSAVAEKSSQEGNIEERFEGEAFQLNSEDQCCKERNTIQNTESENNEEVKPSNFKSEGQDFEQISTNGVDPHRAGDCTVDAGISAEERKQEQEDDKNQEIPNFVAAELNHGAIKVENETEPEETQRYSEQVPLPAAIADEMSSVIAIAEDTSSMDKTVPPLPDSHISMEKYFQKGVTESIEDVSTTKEVNEDKGTSVIEQEDYRDRTIPGSSIETNFFILEEYARSYQNKPETVSEKCGESQNIEEAMATNGAKSTDDLIEEYKREKKSEELHATLGSEAVKDKLNLTLQQEKFSTECEEFEGSSQREPGKKQKKITSEFNLEVQGDGRKEELSEVPEVVDTENLEEQKSEDDEMLDQSFQRVKEGNKFEEVQPSDLPSKEQDIKSVASSTDKTETSTFSNEENQSNVGEASPHTTNSTEGGIKEEASGKQGEPTELAAKGNIMEITCLKGETSPDKPKRDTQIIYKPEQSLKDEKNLNKLAAKKLEPEQQMHETNEVSQTTEVANVPEVIEKMIKMSATQYVVEKIKETEKSTNEPEITPIGEKIELTSMINESAKLDEEAPTLNVQYQIIEKYSPTNTTESENPEEERIGDEKTTKDLEIAFTKHKEIEVGDKGKRSEEESLEEEVNNKVFNSCSMLSEQNNETLGSSTKETMYVEDEELPNERFNAPAIAGVLAKESKEEVCGEVARRPDLFNMTNTVKMISEENNPEFATTETTTQEGPNEEEEKLQSTQADPVFIHEEAAISDITEEIKQKEDRNSTTEISSTRGHVLHLMPEEQFDQTITTSKKYPAQTMVEEVVNEQNWIVEEHKTRQVQYVEPESMEKAEDDPNQKHIAFEPNKVQLSDLLEVSARDTIVKAENFKEESSPKHQHDEFKSKMAANVDTEDINMQNVKEEDEEHKSSDVPVIVEASGEKGPKPPPKKSHNILSGVGSKVKHSIAKVKKAITGKSSHTKTVSPKQEIESSTKTT